MPRAFDGCFDGYVAAPARRTALSVTEEAALKRAMDRLGNRAAWSLLQATLTAAGIKGRAWSYQRDRIWDER